MRMDEISLKDRCGRKPLRFSRKWKWMYVLMMAVSLGLTSLCIRVFVQVFTGKGFYLVSLLLIAIGLLPFGILIRRQELGITDIVLVAVMSALTVLSRLAFFMTPGIKPMAAIIIIAGAGLGPETGILVGFIATFASNFLFGQGLFTPWQMYSFALIGLLSGLLFYRKKISRLRAAVFGGISVLALYGPIMDVATVYIAMENPDTQAILSSLSVGLPFNLLHAGSTVIFLLLMYEPMIKKLHRVK